MLKLQNKLDAKITDQERRSRRENFRIYGIPEGAEKESTSMIAFKEEFLSKNLEMPRETSLQKERAHRALGSPPPENAQPRSILVRFLSFKTKETILLLAWQKRGLIWKGKQINLDNDYAPRILQKRREYTEIRRILKERQIPFQTLYLAQLKLKYEDETRIYETVEKATQDLLKRGFPVERITPSETLMDKLRLLTWERRSRQMGRRAPRHCGGDFNIRLNPRLDSTGENIDLKGISKKSQCIDKRIRHYRCLEGNVSIHP